MLRILAYLLLALGACAANAQSLDLYAGEVPVKGKGEAERRQAIPSALIHTLQKLSGQREIEPSPQLDLALAGAERMMLAFHYDEVRRLLPDGSSQPETWLVVNFLPDAVDGVARELELPRWRQERPPLTFWVLLDDGSGRRLLPLEYEYAWDAMSQVAHQRGLPILRPEIDPEAPPAIDLQLVWGGFTEQVPKPASPSGGIVVVAARRLGPEWQLRWTYDSGLETAGWRSQDLNLSIALTDGLHRLTDLVADRDSIRAAAGASWQLSLSVSGLDGPEAYARCLSYLDGLSPVDELVVVSAAPGQVVFRLVLNAEPRYFHEVLLRDRVLESGTAPDSYRLVR